MEFCWFLRFVVIVVRAVFRSISWAQCLPVVTAEFLEKLAHFLTFVVKIG